MLEHALDGVQQLAHGGGEGDSLVFAPRSQVLVKGSQIKLMADGDQGGHVEERAAGALHRAL